MPHEGLGQGNDVRQGIAKLVAVMPDPGRIRESSGQDRGPRRSTDRLLGVGPSEQAAGGGEPINVGGNGQIVPITSEGGPEIVDGDEEDIGTSGVLRLASHCQGQEEAQSYAQQEGHSYCNLSLPNRIRVRGRVSVPLSQTAR